MPLPEATGSYAHRHIQGNEALACSRLPHEGNKAPRGDDLVNLPCRGWQGEQFSRGIQPQRPGLTQHEVAGAAAHAPAIGR